MTQDTNTASGAAEPDNVTRQPAWSLGYIDGNWRDIDHQDRGGVMRIVWKMEGEERTPECEDLAYVVIAALNGAAEHEGWIGQILRSGGTRADRTIENCPELNMGNYDGVDVERLNDWAIRANGEIDRLHALAAGQATP